MATKQVTVNDDDSYEVKVDFLWVATSSEHLDSEDLIDVSDLSNEIFNPKGKTIGRIRITEIKSNIHLVGTGNENALAVFLMDSNNVPLLVLDSNNTGYCNFESAERFLTTDIYSNNANGNLKIGIGTSITASNGNAVGNASVGSTVHLYLKGHKVADE